MRQIAQNQCVSGIVGIGAQTENHFSLGSDQGKFSSDWTGGE
jgi:hypothetical protein